MLIYIKWKPYVNDEGKSQHLQANSLGCNTFDPVLRLKKDLLLFIEVKFIRMTTIIVL